MDTITNKIIDIHNHSLPEVDDGAKTIEEAVANINYLKSLGITDIILTSHYIVNTKYNINYKQREEILEKLKKEVTGINLYLGNELFISDSKTIENLLKTKEITTLNQSKYLLIEFPLQNEMHHMEEIICDLNELGITPIIAHPERYSYYSKKIEKLLEYDCLFQCNIRSIIGYHGKKAKKIIKNLLKENKVSFLATDFHHLKDDSLKKALKKIKKTIGEEKAKELLEKNPKKVIQNEEIK